jgi:hypothetical protein
MAIRCQENILRQGKMIAEQKQNEQNLIVNNFWNRVNIVKECHDDAIDFIDTAKALYQNGLGGKFETWCKSQNVTYYALGFRICCLSDNKQSAYVTYYPLKDMITFSWSGWGMSECYSTTTDAEYFISHYLKDKKYDKGLTDLSIRLKPFLNAFFEWIETL